MYARAREIGHPVGACDRRVLTATAVRAGDDLKQMTVGVFEVRPAAAVVGVDPAGAALAGVGPVFEALFADALEGLVELVFAN